MFNIGIANGKFGELLQGALPGNDLNFVVSLPISRFSVAIFNWNETDNNITVDPPHKTKALSLLKKILNYYGMSTGCKLTIISQIEEGKGLASSTADLIACTRAISTAIGKKLPPEVLFHFLQEIEPSDGIMLDGVVSFYHRRVDLHSQLGYLPELMIVGVDEGGMVDTINFNQHARPYSSAEKRVYADLLSQMDAAIKNNDLNKVGKISTQSAIFHQELNPKKNLNLFIDICETVGALGVIVAHSGTYIGIMLDKHNPDYLNQLHYIETRMQHYDLSIKKFETLTEQTRLHREFEHV